MTPVNADQPADTRTVFQLLWTALRRARADGMAVIASDPDVIGPLTASHARLLDQLPPDGARVTELAGCVRVSKQALGQLAAQLADRGYLEIVPDPSDRRAKLVRCTPRGHRAQQAIRTTTAMVEDRWRSEVGDARYAVFREVLIELGRAAEISRE